MKAKVSESCRGWLKISFADSKNRSPEQYILIQNAVHSLEMWLNVPVVLYLVELDISK